MIASGNLRKLIMLKMAIEIDEIVDLPISHGDFPVHYVSVPEGRGLVSFPIDWGVGKLPNLWEIMNWPITGYRS